MKQETQVKKHVAKKQVKKSYFKQDKTKELLLSELQDRIVQLFSQIDLVYKPRSEKIHIVDGKSETKRIKTIDLKGLVEKEKFLSEYVKDRGKENISIKKFQLLIEGIQVLSKFTDIFVSFGAKQEIIFEPYGVVFSFLCGKKEKDDKQGLNKFQYDMIFSYLKSKRKKGTPATEQVLVEFIKRIEKNYEFELNQIRDRIKEINSISKEFVEVRQYLSKF